MHLSRRALLGSAAGISALPLARGRAQARPVIKIGVLTDLSGTYRDNTGPTSVLCARQAVAEFNPATHGFEVALIAADHQNKPNVAASITRQWFDQGVDAVADVPTSSVALAVAEVARGKDKIMLNASATVASLTDAQCSPNTIVWSFDTYSNAQSTGGALMAAGQKTWFFLTADYAFGHSLEELTAAVVRKRGGTVKGALRYPFPDTTDFSSFLSQAAASGAEVLALANAGLDTQNCIKQAHKFGLNARMKIAPLLMFISDVHALGPELTTGLTTTESFYWDLNDRTRAFTRRVLSKGVKPHLSQAQASAYGITLHYLKTVAAMGGAEAKQSGRATVARMKAIPTDDDAFGPGRVRADGRGAFPAYLFQVKAPEEGWDLYKLIHTTPPTEALHPLNAKCQFPIAT